MRSLKKYFAFSLILVLLSSFVVSCTGQDEKSITLATTTSTDDSGLLAEILPVFEEESGINVKVIAVGTGQAIDLAERGDADVLLVHAREAEDEFMEAGYGKVRKDVMYNDFVLLGPVNDPADVKDNNVVEALNNILTSESNFISRGDDSGTHKKELGLWGQATLNPGGDWYREVGQGMGATLQVANEMQGYTMSDRATYLAYQGDLELDILVEGGEELLNPYGVIAVNPQKFPYVKYEEAMEFIEFLVSSKGQELIAEYGIDEFGQPLFFPDAK